MHQHEIIATAVAVIPMKKRVDFAALPFVQSASVTDFATSSIACVVSDLSRAKVYCDILPASRGRGSGWQPVG